MDYKEMSNAELLVMYGEIYLKMKTKHKNQDVNFSILFDITRELLNRMDKR